MAKANTTNGSSKQADLIKELITLRRKCATKGLSDSECKHFLTTCKYKKSSQKRGGHWKYTVWAIILGVLAVGVMFLSVTGYGEELIMDAIYGSKCVFDNNAVLMEAARPVMSCDLCKNIKQVPVVYNISTEDFVEHHAYKGIPLLVKEATKNWTAMNEFGFHFFKNLYIDRLSDEEDEQCQFFPYKTSFKTLKDVFEMSDDRADFKPGEKPWYIGWSNCDDVVGKTLRQHYNRPYFLPTDSESSITDWIFMGGTGLGAFMHLDYVQRPSWQAQISGMKTWRFVPPPECESICSSMNVTVHKGDILVVDTNLWYHETRVHPGEMSISIGSEYD